MVERSLEGFDLYPARLIGDTAYGTAEMLNWLVNEHGIEPHIPVFDKSQHTDGTFSRDDFAYDHKRDCYICPAGKELRQRQKIYRMPRPLVDRNGMMRYRASKLDCQGCPLKPRWCPNAPARKIPRSIHEDAPYGARHRQDRGLCHLKARTEEGRDAVHPPQTHPESRPAAITRAERRPR
jgi:hypothetical protein